MSATKKRTGIALDPQAAPRAVSIDDKWINHVVCANAYVPQDVGRYPWLSLHGEIAIEDSSPDVFRLTIGEYPFSTEGRSTIEDLPISLLDGLPGLVADLVERAKRAGLTKLPQQD